MICDIENPGPDLGLWVTKMCRLEYIVWLDLFQLLKHATVHMMDARSRQHGMMGNPDTAQLLLIVSDGRGLFMEGMETVKSAVRQARESNIFLVFVIIDNPVAKVLHR